MHLPHVPLLTLRPSVPSRHSRRTLLGVVLATLLVSPSSPALAAVSPAGATYPRLERFALSLLNCTRTGGWVTSHGRCKGRGSGRYSKYRKPLAFGEGLASRVARPYSLRLARADACRHDLGGTSITRRFHAGGYRGYPYGESIGCSGGYTVHQMVIRTHRLFQSEQRANGWHWRNLKNPDFRRVGVGVEHVGQESRVVYDFYGP